MSDTCETQEGLQLLIKAKCKECNEKENCCYGSFKEMDEEEELAYSDQATELLNNTLSELSAIAGRHVAGLCITTLPIRSVSKEHGGDRPPVAGEEEVVWKLVSAFTPYTPDGDPILEIADMLAMFLRPAPLPVLRVILNAIQERVLLEVAQGNLDFIRLLGMDEKTFADLSNEGNDEEEDTDIPIPIIPGPAGVN